jgi:hypothetical protein
MRLILFELAARPTHECKSGAYHPCMYATYTRAFYWVFDDLCTRVSVAWNLSLNSHPFDAAIWEHFVALLRKKELHELFTVVLWSGVGGCACVICLDYIVFRKKYSPFSRWWHIVEALNELVDDSGSEGDVSETEHSPSESFWFRYVITFYWNEFQNIYSD